MIRRFWMVLAGVLALVPALAAQSAPAAKPEPEEPDFAFVSGSAYTQAGQSAQFIHQTGLASRRFTDPLGKRNEDAFLFFQRVEYGITDRWELDFVLPAAGRRTRLNGSTVSSDYALADGLAGLRYRLLNEEASPATVAMGPQLIFPSGSARHGTGNGSAGVAWDLAVSKDWGGPVFLYNTLNYHVVPSADDTTPGSSARQVLHGVQWATALGIRALERPSKGGSKHDLHAFLEAGGNWQQGVEPGITSGTRTGELTWVLAPGIRYGFITARKTLVEIGVSIPVGLGPNGPKRGFILQFQFERMFADKTP